MSVFYTVHCCRDCCSSWKGAQMTTRVMNKHWIRAVLFMRTRASLLHSPQKTASCNIRCLHNYTIPTRAFTIPTHDFTIPTREYAWKCTGRGALDHFPPQILHESLTPLSYSPLIATLLLAIFLWRSWLSPIGLSICNFILLFVHWIVLRKSRILCISSDFCLISMYKFYN